MTSPADKSGRYHREVAWVPCSQGGLWRCIDCDAHYASPPWVKDKVLLETCTKPAATIPECGTCNDDPAVCATVPGLRHCEAAAPSESPTPTDAFYEAIKDMEPRRALLKMYDHARQIQRELAVAKRGEEKWIVEANRLAFDAAARSARALRITEVVGADGKGVAAPCAIDGCALMNGDYVRSTIQPLGSWPSAMKCKAPESSGQFRWDGFGKMVYDCHTCGATGDGASSIVCRFVSATQPLKNDG